MSKRVLPLLLALCLSACGFHLRGLVELPVWLTQVAIINQDGNNRELVSFLKEQLEGYKVHVHSDPLQAAHWLIINRSSFQQQITSVGASTNPRQYQLSLTVEFMLQTRKGQIIKPPRDVVVIRQMTVNNDRILGSNDEERLLMSEMLQEAAVQILNRLGR